MKYLKRYRRVTVGYVGELWTICIFIHLAYLKSLFEQALFLDESYSIYLLVLAFNPVFLEGGQFIGDCYQLDIWIELIGFIIIFVI